jgi:hypothetical protein
LLFFSSFLFVERTTNTHHYYHLSYTLNTASSRVFSRFCRQKRRREKEREEGEGEEEEEDKGPKD